MKAEPLVKKMADFVDKVDRINEANGFHDILGYRQLEWEDGRAVLELPLRQYHLNLGGVVHGAVLTGLLDVVCAQAGLYCPYPGRMRKAVTLSLTTTFTGQASSGVIRAIGTLRSRGSRIFNCSGEVLDEEGRLLAMGEGTFRTRSGSEGPEGVPFDMPTRKPAAD